jgi:PAS domain S-box-containing protein
MMHPIRTIRRFVRELGPVEQAQVVASTAVVVSMVTIVSAMAATGHTPRLMDFISVLTIGLFGFITVYFSLRYGRQLDAQRRHLLAVNTIADALNRVDDFSAILNSALNSVADVLNAAHCWVYLQEAAQPVLKCSRGNAGDFLQLQGIAAESFPLWAREPRAYHEQSDELHGLISPALKELNIQFLASIPLTVQDSTVGAIIVASLQSDPHGLAQVDLMMAFSNQISAALNNATLFEWLKRSQSQYADLFENAPDMYFSVGPDRIILACNASSAKALGIPSHDLVGKPCEDCFAEDRRGAVRDLLDRMLTRGEPLLDVEEVMVDSNGRRFSVHLNSSLYLDEMGHTVNARILVRDITQRKKMEQALLHAQKIDSIGNLAGGIAHDFNNILAAILGSATVMRRHMTTKSKLYKYVDIIDSSSRRGSSLTRQLLTFARKTERQDNILDMNELIQGTLLLFQRSVAKNIELETSLTKDPVNVIGDEGQLQQALLNVMINARDAMPDGGRIRIASDALHIDASVINEFSSVKPGPCVSVRITDSGVGIPRSVQARVFEPFFSTKDQATGLGLSVVYGVVQNHGGSINLESEPGCGTSITLYFPRVPGKKDHSTSIARIPKGTETLLVIDDEEGVSEIMRDMLSGLGYTVYVEHDGRAGVEFYRTQQDSIDLILLDINMPVLSGKDAFREFRGINPAVRIVIVTGYGRGNLEMTDFVGGINGLVQKPFQLELLAITVRRALDDQESGRQPSTSLSPDPSRSRE